MNLPYWAQIPMGAPGIASFGHEVDLTTAIRYLGDSCIIAGIHLDNITKEEIEQILENTSSLVDRFISQV